MADIKTKFQNRYSATVEANRLESFVDNKKLLPVYASSTAKIYPYQIAAANFALRSEYLKGCILCDEGSLGKTYEAILIAGQKWYEGKENILVILPSNLIKQWQNKLNKHFTIPHCFWNNTKDIPQGEGIVLTTYECAIKYADKVKEINWNLVIFDEADVLSNHHNKTVITLRDSVKQAYKLLLTPTPITLDIRDIYGLIHFIDDSFLPDENEFYKRYFRKPENYPELTKLVSQFCFRTLKAQTTEYVNFSRRIPFTVDYPLISEEKELYNLIKMYLLSDDKIAYPDIENYNLNLLFWKTLSSSPVALVEMLKPAITRTYGIEKATLQQIQKLASQIEVNSKTLQLLKILKTVFHHLKSTKVNQKVIIFVEKSATLDYLYRIFLRNGYNTLKYKDNETLDKFRNEDEIQILITTDKSAKGLDIEYCPVVVNYDLLYNAIEMEQRICRCHRQGQLSDVLVINLLCKENFADVRVLELINKRTLQFNGIFGMSDDIVGNFDTKLKDVLESFRHIETVAQDFKDNLGGHKVENEELVKASEEVLFTTFTKSVAEKITITPDYIEDKTTEINFYLWELIKYYFLYIQPNWYTIDDNKQEITLIDGYRRPYLFSYNDVRPNQKYEGYQKYSMKPDFLPQRGRIALTTIFAKGILSQLDTSCPKEAKIIVNADIEPCEIGYYAVNISSSKSEWYKKHKLVGQTVSGKILNEEECRKILSLEVQQIEERGSFEYMRFGSLLSDLAGIGNIDNLISKDEILQEYFRSKEGSIAYEVEKLKLIAGKKKAQLETKINELKVQISELKKKIGSKETTRLEELEITKELRILENEIRKQENDLFFELAKIDVNTENEIKELTNEYNFEVKFFKKFRVQVFSKIGN